MGKEWNKREKRSSTRTIWRGFKPMAVCGPTASGGHRVAGGLKLRKPSAQRAANVFNFCKEEYQSSGREIRSWLLIGIQKTKQNQTNKLE